MNRNSALPSLCVAFLLGLLCPAALPAQEGEAKEEEKQVEEEKQKPEEPPEDRYEMYVMLKDVKYVAPEQAGAQQALEFKFDLDPDIPKGMKIEFVLEYYAVEIEAASYTLKDEIRTGLTFTWRFKEKLPLREYYLRTRMVMNDQTPEVRKLFAGKAKKFPPENEPWSWYYADKPITFGSDEEKAAEAQAMCDAYKALTDELVSNLTEFQDSMEAVKEGKECVQGAAMDVKKFTDLVVVWRKRQGETQKKIAEFPAKERALHMRDKAAHYKLMELGQMVSKRAVIVQKEVTDKYGVAVINPAVETFSSGYRYATNAQRLNKAREEILERVCPQEEEEPEEGTTPEEEAPAEKPGGEPKAN